MCVRMNIDFGKIKKEKEGFLICLIMLWVKLEL